MSEQKTSDGRGMIRSAVAEAKSLKSALVEDAKHKLVEQMVPNIRNLLENFDESADRAGDQGSQYYNPATRAKAQRWEENKQGENDMAADEKSTENGAEKELDLEALFPGLAEEDEVPMDAQKQEDEAVGIPSLGESDDADKDDEVQVSEAEVAKFYESLLQTEATVSKGFKDMVGGGELDQASKETGILDKKSGEKAWEAESPPDAKDFTVKEAIKRGLAENKMLRKKLSESVALIKKLGTALHEGNLFNAKVLHVNKVLNKYGQLTREQRSVVVESIDKAKSIVQVKMVYETICSSFTATSAGKLTESSNRRPVANSQRARTSGNADQKVLRESVEREDGEAGTYSRMQLLAGIVK